MPPPLLLFPSPNLAQVLSQRTAARRGQPRKRHRPLRREERRLPVPPPQAPRGPLEHRGAPPLLRRRGTTPGLLLFLLLLFLFIFRFLPILLIFLVVIFLAFGPLDPDLWTFGPGGRRSQTTAIRRRSTGPQTRRCCSRTAARTRSSTGTPSKGPAYGRPRTRRSRTRCGQRGRAFWASPSWASGR